MCRYPTLIRNKKYQVNNKNGGNVPKIKDKRTEYVPIGCGKCIDCRKQKARQWQVRLLEEIKTNKGGKFVTLTFSDEAILELDEEITEQEKEADIEPSDGYERDNKIATQGVRWWLERWRKKYKKSIRHWLITEIGGHGSENIHLHGIVWVQDLDTLEQIWQYGYIWKGTPRYDRRTGKKEMVNYVNEATISYITKYVTKPDEKHKNYIPKILTSKGMGKNYTQAYNSKQNTYKEKGTIEAYTTRQGFKMNLPIYYRNKLYTEEQREKLWIQKLDKNERWLNGIKYNVSDEKGMDIYYKALKGAQQENRELGYGGHELDWEEQRYEKQRRNMMRKERKYRAENNNNNKNRRTIRTPPGG